MCCRLVLTYISVPLYQTLFAVNPETTPVVNIFGVHSTPVSMFKNSAPLCTSACVCVKYYVGCMSYHHNYLVCKVLGIM